MFQVRTLSYLLLVASLVLTSDGLQLGNSTPALNVRVFTGTFKQVQWQRVSDGQMHTIELANETAGSINSLRMLDANRLAIGSYGRVHIWSLSTGECERTLVMPSRWPHFVDHILLAGDNNQRLVTISRKKKKTTTTTTTNSRLTCLLK